MLIRTLLAATMLVAVAADADARGRGGGGKSRSWSSSSYSSKPKAPKSKRTYKFESTTQDNRSHQEGAYQGTSDEPAAPVASAAPVTRQMPANATYMTTAPETPDRHVIHGPTPPPTKPTIGAVSVIGPARTEDLKGQCVSVGAVQCIWERQKVDHWPVNVGDKATRTELTWPDQGLPFDRERFSKAERTAIIEQSASQGYVMRAAN